MGLPAADLARLSVLLDEADELDAPALEGWLAGLEGESARLAPVLRDLLARHAAQETNGLLDQLPVFLSSTVVGPAAGDLVGPYRLLSELGSGGMGAVWLAERADGTLTRKVALKLPHVSWAQGLAERFTRERDILASLEHPNIARLYDAGFDSHGRPYMALEYVEGVPIGEFCKRGALPVEGRLRLLLQVADAVAFAHGRLVVHRDLKPGNILVTDDGQVRLLDFGIAKLIEGEVAQETALTRAGGRVLTPDYASPEQIRGEPIGTASDVYSLGVVAFELLAGARPYKLKRPSAAALEEAIASEEAPLASEVADDKGRKKRLAGDLDAILNKALKKSAADRYPTVDALAQDWRRHLDGYAVTARPDTLAYRLARLARRHRVPVASAAVASVAFGLALGVGATALVIFVLLLGLAAALWQARRASEQARLARAEGRKAEAVKRFLLDIFQANSHAQPDPRKAQQTTARELLDIGVKRVDEALRDEPESHIEMLDSLAELYFQIGLRTDSIRLRRQATNLARQVFGPNDRRFALIAILCARAMESSAERAEVPRLLDEANTALIAAGEADTPTRGTLLRELASYHGYESLGPAISIGEESAAVMRRTAIGVEVSNACRVAGRMRMISGHYDLAEQHYRNALAAPPDPADFNPGWQVNSHAELATALHKQGRIEEAESHGRAAAAQSTTHYGADHRWTLVVKTRLSNQLVGGGKLDDALALSAEVDDALRIDRPEYDAAFRANMAGYFGATFEERGRPDLAEAPQREDLEDLRANFPNSYVRAQREADIAALEALRGRYEEAHVLLCAGTDRWQRYSGGHHEPARDALFAYVGARLAMSQRQNQAALSCVERVELPTTAARGRFCSDTLRLVAERIRVETAVGRAEAAQQRADAELRALRRHLRNARLPDAEARLLLASGEALLALGDLPRAQLALREAVALRTEHDDRASLWLAEAQIALARCLVHLRQGDQARALLDSARAIDAQHPSMAAFLAGPLGEAMQLAGPP